MFRVKLINSLQKLGRTGPLNKQTSRCGQIIIEDRVGRSLLFVLLPPLGLLNNFAGIVFSAGYFMFLARLLQQKREQEILQTLNYCLVLILFNLSLRFQRPEINQHHWLILRIPFIII